MARHRPSVLLLSAAPLAHSRAACDLIERGYRVRVVNDEAALDREASVPHEFVLVDLVYPAAVRAPWVDWLNRRQHGGPVLAIHDGRLDDVGMFRDVSIDGWARAGEPLAADWLMARRGTVDMSGLH